MRRWLALAAFCLLAGSRWLVDEARPTSLPPLLARSIGFAVCALAVLPFWALGSRRVPAGGWLRVSLAGLLVFGVPALLNELAGGVVRESGAALFAAAPFLIVMAGDFFEAERGVRGLMTPALIGLGGALLLLPFAVPVTARAGGMFLLAIISVAMTALGSVWMHRVLCTCGSWAGAVMVVCVVNAVFLCLAALAHGGFSVPVGLGAELGRAILVDLPSLLLLLWLMRAIPAERLAARFFLVPLVAVVEGLFFVHPRIDLRAGTGMVLLAVGAGLMLRPVPGTENTGLGLGGSQ